MRIGTVFKTPASVCFSLPTVLDKFWFDVFEGTFITRLVATR